MSISFIKYLVSGLMFLVVLLGVVMKPGSTKHEFGVNSSRQASQMSKLSVNRKGEIAITNSTFMQGVSSHIWIFRGQSEL